MVDAPIRRVGSYAYGYDPYLLGGTSSRIMHTLNSTIDQGNLHDLRIGSQSTYRRIQVDAFRQLHGYSLSIFAPAHTLSCPQHTHTLHWKLGHCWYSPGSSPRTPCTPCPPPPAPPRAPHADHPRTRGSDPARCPPLLRAWPATNGAGVAVDHLAANS